MEKMIFLKEETPENTVIFVNAYIHIGKGCPDLIRHLFFSQEAT